MAYGHAAIFLAQFARNYARIYAKDKEGQFRHEQALTIDMTMF